MPSQRVTSSSNNSNNNNSSSSSSSNSNSNSNSHHNNSIPNKQKQQQKAAANDLPVPIHPDDAKDKVLTAILKALLKMENKPSSPKELATIINKHKYATLGGATPFATVSSRISQHFKRAATHNPPRPPLLEKHVDQNHSRKISYSLALDSSPSSSSNSPPVEHVTNKRKQQEQEQEDEEEDASSDSSLSSMSDSDNERHSVSLLNKKRKLKSATPTPDIFISPNSPPPSQDKLPIQQQQQQHINYTAYIDDDDEEEEEEDDDDDSNSEHSDYHEEMLKQVDDNATIHHTPSSSAHLSLPNSRRYSMQSDNNISAERKASFCSGYPTGTDQELWTSFSFNNEHHQQDEHQHHHGGDPTAHLIPFHIDTPESVSVSELDDYFANDSTSRKRKSLSKSMMGPNDESLLDKVLFDSAAKGVAGKLNQPQQPCRDEITTMVTQENHTTDDHREVHKMGENVKMEVIQEEDEEEDVLVKQEQVDEEVVSKQEDEDENKKSQSDQKEQQQQQQVEKQKQNACAVIDQKEGEQKRKPCSFSSDDIKMIDSDAMTGEDFVRFEEEEEEEEEEEDEVIIMENDHNKQKSVSSSTQPPSTAISQQQQQANVSSNLPSISPLTTLPTSSSSSQPLPSTSSILPLSSSSSSSSPSTSSSSSTIPQANAANTIKKVADILPATTSPSQQQQNIIHAAEILKSMNIQTLNLSALHHMTSSIPSLQHLSPAFDLAKTMAAYMQSLAKSANANSGTPLATDLKNILSRFPALEAFIKKDQQQSNDSAVLPTSSSSSSLPPLPTATDPPKPNRPYVPPHHIQGKDQVVYTVNPTDPPMYLTVIDSIAVCVVVFSTKSTNQEYRIMRRLDNQFINGTTLLTAGGIETERERSMILSFEIDRVRMPKADHPLFGTWIPLRRAQELARTCSIQNTLAHFLDTDMLHLFPSPLPIKIISKKKVTPTTQNNHHRLAALALAALRNQSHTKPKQALIDNPNKLLKSTGGKWASSAPLIKKSASWNGAVGVKRQPSGKQRKAKQVLRHVSDDEEEVIIDIEDDDEEEEEEVNVVVEHQTEEEPAMKEEEPVPEKEGDAKVVVHEEEEEEDDEDIDIGGSDCDDDLR